MDNNDSTKLKSPKYVLYTPSYVTTVAESDRQLESNPSYKVTNDKTLSTLQSKDYFEIDSFETDSESERNKLGVEFSFYPTFGTKYPFRATVEDTSEDEATTERINVEDLERQLMDVLNQLADKHSN